MASIDSAVGMVLGGSLGDALGAPHEFYGSPRGGVSLQDYTGVLEFPLEVRSKGETRRGIVGQVTDDTEMTCALMAAIAAKKGAYVRRSAIKRYVTWANSHPLGMGKNTRELFLGVKRVSEFEGRREAKKIQYDYSWTQSNGCLMRAAPLALTVDPLAAAAEDCALTNFHPNCINACEVYVGVLRELVGRGAPRERGAALFDRIRRVAFSLAKVREVQATLESALDSMTPRDVTSQRGWVLHGLWCAFRALRCVIHPSATYGTIIDWVVRLGGDTDTNAAIAGSLVGAWFGLEGMKKEERTRANLRVLMDGNPAHGDFPRPYEYSVPQLVTRTVTVAESMLGGN